MDLLAFAAPFSDPDQSHRITLEIFPDGKPVRITSRTERNEEFVGLIMPVR
jgi:hypothetical protein